MPKSTVDRVAEESIFKIGRVTSVDGRTVTVKVDKSKNTSHLVYRGELLKNVVVGSYLKIAKGFTSIIGKVDGEFITEEADFQTGQYGSQKEKIDRKLRIKLLGYFEGNSFKRGIKELPLIDNECFLLHKDEFQQLHNFLGPNDEPLTIGTLSLEKGQEIQVGVDGLFASHIGIFGNTGSGKSYTLACLYRKLFEKYKQRGAFRQNARFFLIDFNGEYVDEQDGDIIVEREYKNIFPLSTRRDNGARFPISEAALSSPEFWSVFLDATEKTQRPFVRRALTTPYIAGRIQTERELKDLIGDMLLQVLTADDRSLEKGLITSFLTDLRDSLGGNEGLRDLAEDYRTHLIFHTQQLKFFYVQNGDRIYSDNQNFEQDVVRNKLIALNLPVNQLDLLDRIRLRIVLQYYEEIFRGYANRDHLAPLIKRLDTRIDDLKKVITIGDLQWDRNFTIVSLRDVNIHLRKILPLLLCKRLYDDQKETDQGTTYLNIIVDEAHNILSEESVRESEQWKDYRLETFEEIIKEGRKFGVFLTIASQRPADISPTIISQLHNYFLHRLINDKDIKAVEKTISYLDKISFEYLPILPTGSCVFAGILANIPVVVDIDAIDPRYEPRNKTRILTNTWRDEPPPMPLDQK